jgi:hypothetical protein
VAFWTHIDDSLPPTALEKILIKDSTAVIPHTYTHTLVPQGLGFCVFELYLTFSAVLHLVLDVDKASSVSLPVCGLTKDSDQAPLTHNES